MTVRHPAWDLVALLCATATAGYLCRVNASTAGALLMQEFGLSQVAMGRVFSAFLLGYALCMVPAGSIADRCGARRVLTAAACGWVALTLLQALVGWGLFSTTAAFPALLALRFLLGMVAAPTYPAAAAGIAGWIAPPLQGRAAGIVLASIGLGSAIAPPLLSLVMVRWGWRASLVVSAMPALLVAVLWLLVREPKPAAAVDLVPRRPQRGSVPWHLLRRRGFALLTASYTLQGYVGYIFIFWFYLYLVQERHFDLLQGAWMGSVPWLLSIASIPLGGWLAMVAALLWLGIEPAGGSHDDERDVATGGRGEASH